MLKVLCTKMLLMADSNMGEKRLLYEVSIIRPLIIFLLVVLHSFAPLVGSWSAIDGVEINSVYYWFCKFIQGFRIETIALIAGYVFAYQSIIMGRKYDFLPFVWKKVKRLIIPCIVFSLIYFFLFNFDINTFNPLSFCLTILSGAGHLWFLPMLFWCFVVIWVIDKYKLSSWWLWAILCLLSIYPIPLYVPLGFQRLPHFLFYCFCGYFLYERHQSLTNKIMNWRSIGLLWLIYISATIVSVLYILPQVKLLGSENITNKLVWYGAQGVFNLVCSLCGIMALYLMVMKVTTRTGYHPNQWIIDASKICYGVYVFHQFILEGLYYHTNIPQNTNVWLLPWIMLFITCISSYILTKLTLLTKTGRFLIG